MLLQDNTLDWDSKLPDDELQVTVDRADEAVGVGGKQEEGGGKGQGGSLRWERRECK